MTKYQSLVFRFILFLAGAGIILLTFFLTSKGKVLGPNDTFTWISIGVMYIVAFLPFLFSALNIRNFSTKIPSLSVVMFGLLFYIAASIIVIILLKLIEGFTLNAAIIIQSILFFIILINLYFSFFASSHSAKVAEEEDDKRYYLTKIKSKAGVVLLSVNKLSGEYENAQKVLKQTIDDIKFIYPVDNDMGTDLEANIFRSLNSIAEIMSSIQSGANNPSLESAAINLQSLVNERKLLRN